MKTITALAIGFLLLVGFALGTYAYVNTSANDLVTSLETVEKSIADQKWDTAKENLKTAENKWDKTKVWWTILLDHQEIDNIDISINRLEKYVETHGTTLSLGEISALLMLVDHISEKEAPSLKNIL